MKILALAVRKGGVGKSAVAFLTARHFAHSGLRVLAIDIDDQGHLSKPIRRSGKAVVAEITADQLFTDPDAAIPVAPFVLVPAGPGLTQLERESGKGRDVRNTLASNFRAALLRAKGSFDVAVIDTPPGIDIRLLAALVSASHVLSPIQLSDQSISGLVQLLKDPAVGIERIKEMLNPQLDFLGILPNMVERNPNQVQGMNDLMANPTFFSRLFSLVDEPKTAADICRIPKREVIRECHTEGLLPFEWKDKTAARDAWKELRPVLDRIGVRMGVMA
ncbi:ParA family protein [Azohydromonas lata]|uniref:ParA family protein n=1 Tax=Azohydromonas lata TaxID=45677 RepID=UPI00082D923A|nr:ParA family protein [Azohydromonas lata]